MRSSVRPGTKLVPFFGGLFLLGTLILLVIVWSPGFASATNGFDISGALVPENEIFHGGPPRDGIPAIDRPKFISAGEATFLNPEDRVLGVFHNSIARAYPVLVLNYHEIVNDRFGNDAIVVSFCPLCGTGMVFSASVKGVNRQFGVSGLLYNSDMLLYDRESESLWSQIMMQAISGPLKGTTLEPLAVANTSWADWRSRHPDTQVLSRDTGYARNYSTSPYPGYEQSETVMFPVSHFASQYHPKELVIGLQVGKEYKAYPFSELAKTGKTKITDTFASQQLTILFSTRHRTGTVMDANNNEIPAVISYWFAWMAFHPDSAVYSRD